MTTPNAEQQAALDERIKGDEALHKQLHEQMLSDSKAYDEAIAASAPEPAAEGSEEQLELEKPAPAKKVK